MIDQFFSKKNEYIGNTNIKNRLYNRTLNGVEISSIFAPLCNQSQDDNKHIKYLTRSCILAKLNPGDAYIVDELIRKCRFMDEYIPFDEFINFLEKGTIPPTAIIHHQNKLEKNHRYGLNCFDVIYCRPACNSCESCFLKNEPKMKITYMANK